MDSIIKSKRKIDSIVTIVQDIEENVITIKSINPAAQRLLGFSESEIIGKNFSEILPQNESEFIDEYLEEYQQGDHDVSQALRKIPNFHIKDKKGSILPASLKVFFTSSLEKNKYEFELLMRDLTMINRIKKIKKELSHNNGNEIDSDTGMQNEKKVKSALEITQSFVQNSPVEISFAAATIDNLDFYEREYGIQIALQMITKFGEIISQTCRSDDVVGYLGNGVIGVVLLDCNTENSEAVSKRILQKIVKDGLILENGDKIEVTTTIVYKQLSKTLGSEETYQLCLENLDAMKNRNTNEAISI